MLNVITVEKAQEIIKENFSRIDGFDEIPAEEAVLKTAFEDIVSRENVPSFDRSTMDGYALIAADSYGASESMPAVLTVKGEIRMGECASVPVKSGECMRISTGGMLPPGADSVIPVEYTSEEFSDCLMYKSVAPFQNVTRCGDEQKKGDTVIRKGDILSPARIGLLAAVGETKIKVRKAPVIGIISSGNEVCEGAEEVPQGKIREVNSHLLRAMLKSFGCDTKYYGIARDEYDDILSRVKTALSECDAVLISGGSSAGTKDMTVSVIGALGEVLAHGIAMKPGKPTIIGKCGGKAVFGLPGHPGACFFVTEILVRALIESLSGRELPRASVRKIISENISSNHGREEYICVRLDGENAVPLYGKSGLLSMMSEADGYIKIGRNTEGLNAGEETAVYLFEDNL